MNTDNENIPATPQEDSIKAHVANSDRESAAATKEQSEVTAEETHPVSAHTPAPRRCDSCRKAPRGKLHCHNWLDDIPGGYADFDIVEVQFKNTRKGYYRNTTGLDIAKGDLVAVEASPGHDIGEITLTGRLVALQMKKAGLKRDAEIKRIFRKAKPSDIEKYEEAKARENDTMIKARKIAEDLNLNMKIGDVEYQGDGNKAIFYYIADERVDFRKLIKVLAETFRVRIEMKQIGARQEAGRIGGIGPCGRPLCCSTWMTNFVSVATSAARFQDISLNPQKLAGQCAKLKCCLNFEVDAYVESVRQMPSKDIRLETADNTYFHFKTDIFKREITYSTDKQMAANLVTIPAKRAFEVIALNKAGEKPLSLIPEGSEKPQPKKDFIDLVGQDSLTRFDKTKKKKKKKPQQPKDGNQQPRPKDGQQRPPKANDRKGGNSQPKDKGQQPKPQQPQDATQKPSRGDKGNDRRQQPNKQHQQPRQPKQPKQQPQQKPE
ncbi:PSP1 domain-containing protein [Muribaculum intestinale]|jgi:cell fate regulator YaaT (PSP1 superfamily)|uniref:PSP1 domain-containing protein n=1 Tax=Muribaculum intestinale TaxID=1796646 RepID=UPI0025B1852F|nr:regulatory iron-sulfur-containing complex subunit RicT [Muribaculum intestinale]